MKTLYSIATCAAGTAVAWYGVHGNVMAFNVYRFVTCLSLVLGLLCAVGRHGLTPAQRTRPKIANAVAIATDVSVAFLMAAFGHFVFAVIQIVQIPVEQYIFSPDTKAS
jgi:hypothetical protein